MTVHEEALTLKEVPDNVHLHAGLRQGQQAKEATPPPSRNPSGLPSSRGAPRQAPHASSTTAWHTIWGGERSQLFSFSYSQRRSPWHAFLYTCYTQLST